MTLVLRQKRLKLAEAEPDPAVACRFDAASPRLRF
jgi:hypothetical protein